ncbi:hypothetical protein D7Y11_19870 [Corallococcus sp. AB018]|nr:hypothetical protein D7Y11_19870 [Corallococcus sp. AB018]
MKAFHRTAPPRPGRHPLRSGTAPPGAPPRGRSAPAWAQGSRGASASVWLPRCPPGRPVLLNAAPRTARGRTRPGPPLHR